MSNIQWRKSSRSQVNGECIELSNTLDQMRDSKSPHGATLRVDVLALLSAVKADRLGR